MGVADVDVNVASLDDSRYLPYSAACGLSHSDTVKCSASNPLFYSPFEDELFEIFHTDHGSTKRRLLDVCNSSCSCE